MTDRSPVTKGTLDVIVLRALAWGPMHGFEIVEWIDRTTNQSLDLTDAAVYQALGRCGIRYSSSVSDSRNLPGWSERALTLARESGVTELPVSSLWPAPLGMPVGIPLGGLYWRSCPESVLLRRVRWITEAARST